MPFLINKSPDLESHDRLEKTVWKWTISRPVRYNKLPLTTHNAYQSKTNGIIERLHCILKTAMMTRKQSWFDALAIIMLNIRNMPNSENFFPATAVRETQFLLPKPIIVRDYPNLNKEDIKIS